MESTLNLEPLTPSEFARMDGYLASKRVPSTEAERRDAEGLLMRYAASHAATPKTVFRALVCIGDCRLTDRRWRDAFELFDAARELLSFLDGQEPFTTVLADRLSTVARELERERGDQAAMN